MSKPTKEVDKQFEELIMNATDPLQKRGGELAREVSRLLGKLQLLTDDWEQYAPTSDEANTVIQTILSTSRLLEERQGQLQEVTALSRKAARLLADSSVENQAGLGGTRF